MLRSFRLANHRSFRDEHELLLMPAYDNDRDVVAVAAVLTLLANSVVGLFCGGPACRLCSGASWFHDRPAVGPSLSPAVGWCMLMSVQPQPWPEPAPEIVAAVRAVYARREPPLPVTVRDRLGELFPDAEFAAAFGVRGRPGWSPGRLALVTVLQMAENLTDRQAAEAVRDKISWKYALGLGLDDEGFDASVLSEFRTRVVEHGLEQRVLDLLLAALVEQGLVTAGGRQRTDSTHVISAVRDLNRLELAGESVRACLEALSAVAPDWLGAVIDVAGWSRRYGARIDTWRLPATPAKRTELVAAYGADALLLLRAVSDPQAPAWLRELPAVEVLRVVLVQNYLVTTDATGQEVIRAREGRHGRSPARQSAPELPV